MKQSIRILLLTAAAVSIAAAQDDPPSRVGRLSYLNGQVSFRPGDVDDWVEADYNRPLTSGDHLWTDDGARAEVHIGSTALRLDRRTAFEFLNLDDSSVQIRLAEGRLSVHVRALDDQESYEVDTPNLAFTILRAGEYRFEVNPDNQTTVITLGGGEGEVTGGGQAFAVHARQQAQVSGDDQIAFNVVGAPREDEWDGWCLARDRREDQSVSARYVSREMPGYQDLDDNGTWRQTADYGSVWVPTHVDPGWAPYHDGRWVWVEPWGWTWVDDARWGFAPFHYGRWVYAGYWAWVPGPVRERPVYAPALVAWVGGSNFGISVGGGAGVAWFPLGPREVYVPGYHTSPRYLNRINVSNTTIVNNVNITNVYVNNTYINRAAPGAITAVPQNVFASARPVQREAIRIDARNIQSRGVIRTAPVAPIRESVLGRASAARVSQPPAAIQSRAVVARIAPPPARVSFAQRQSALSANPGRPLEPAQVQQIRKEQPAPARVFVRQAQVPASPSRQVTPTSPSAPPRAVTPSPAPARDANRPPERDVRPANPARPENQTPPAQRENAAPPRVQRETTAPPPVQRDAPPARVQRENTAPPPVQRENAAPPRVQRETTAPPPAQRDAPPARATDRPTETPRPQPRDVTPSREQPRVAQPPARETPRAQPPARDVTPARPQPREAQPARTSDRPPQRVSPRQDSKPDKKDAKKDEKKDKKDDK